jgi:RNA polymerase-binding transcription factor DksA
MTVRYSDEKLDAFKVLIEKKLVEAQEQLENLQAQIIEISENTDDEFGTDWMDDSSTSGNLEMLNNMAIRQRKFIQDLQNALLRIKNKTYGICTITGTLIAEERLRAVPTTTKSIVAKDTPASAAGRVKPASKPAAKAKKKEEEPKKIITKVIKSNSATTTKAKAAFDEDDLDGFDDLDDFNDDEFENDNGIDNADFSDGEELDD